MFRKSEANVFVTNDVASRGMDTPSLDFIVHYHFPSTSKLFMHRSGSVGSMKRKNQEGRDGHQQIQINQVQQHLAQHL